MELVKPYITIFSGVFFTVFGAFTEWLDLIQASIATMNVSSWIAIVGAILGLAGTASKLYWDNIDRKNKEIETLNKERDRQKVFEAKLEILKTSSKDMFEDGDF